MMTRCDTRPSISPLRAKAMPESRAPIADRLRAIGIGAGYDEDEQAVLPDIPDAAVLLFSKRDRQVIGDAKKYVREHDIDWDELNIERKKQLLHEASAQSLETGPIRRLWPSRYRYPRDVKS